MALCRKAKSLFKQTIHARQRHGLLSADYVRLSLAYQEHVKTCAKCQGQGR